MSISERLYIRWFPDEASEPTSTLVLTAHNRQFVDLRLLKPEGGGPPAPFTLLEWGLAGRSVGTPAHGIWIHDIDSRTENAQEEKDEGDMFPQPGHPDVTLERGKMRHPESGEVREYEEAWKDRSVLSVDGRRVSVVLETAAAESGVKGMVVRVGQFCQGILRVGSTIVVERWAWAEDGGWTLSARIGDGAHLPCNVTWNGGLAAGDDCSRDGISWIAKEIHTW